MSKVEKQLNTLSRFLKGMPSEEKIPLLDDLKQQLEAGVDYTTIFNNVSQGKGNNTHCSGLKDGEIVGAGRWRGFGRR